MASIFPDEDRPRRGSSGGLMVAHVGEKAATRHKSSSKKPLPQTTSMNFVEAFAPLAHHLFPDGCPQLGDGCDERRQCHRGSSDSSTGVSSCSWSPCHNQHLLLEEAWPHRLDRRPVHQSEARKSIRHLRLVARSNGLRSGELLAVAVAACTVLPLAHCGGDDGDDGDGVHGVKSGTAVVARRCPLGGKIRRGGGSAGNAPLVDGTTRCFVDLVRCLVPAPPSSDDIEGPGGGVPSSVVTILLSAASPSTRRRCDGPGRAAILRFLTLALRSGRLSRGGGGGGTGVSDDDARRTLASLYAIPFAIALNDPIARPDAVRLLHGITRRRNALPHRARRVRTAYDEAVAEASGGGSLGGNGGKGGGRGSAGDSGDGGGGGDKAFVAKAIAKGNIGAGGGTAGPPQFASLLLLLQLYARYDPRGCGAYFPSKTKLGGRYSRFFKVPDEMWEREFAGEFLLCIASPDVVHNLSDTKQSSGLSPKNQIKNELSAHMESSTPLAWCDGASSSGTALRGGCGDVMVPVGGKRPRNDDVAIVSAFNDREKSLAIKLALDRLEDAFEGVHSSSWELLRSGGTRRSGSARVSGDEGWAGSGDRTEGRRPNGSVRASDLLADVTLRHLILLSCSGDEVEGVNWSGGGSDISGPSVSETEVARLRACLPHMLHEEWYDDGGDEDDENDRECADAEISSSDDEGGEECCGDDSVMASVEVSLSTNSSQTPAKRKRTTTYGQNKIRVIHALSSLASHADALPPEAEAFVVDEILPQWDGGILGYTLCHELLGYLAPTTFQDLNRRVLRHLGKLYVCGSPRIKGAIVSGALTSIVRRWGRLSWPSGHVGTDSHGSNDAGLALGADACKQRVLQELIEWTDNLLLMGLIAEGGSDGGGHELVRLSAVDFFHAVCGLSGGCDFVTPPSPALTYRLLLSNTAVCVDRMCGLLLEYKASFERLKKRKNGSVSGEISGLDRVAVFNCFVWDFCSVLWRCSPLPSFDRNNGDVDLARANSILFTDIPGETLKALHHLPSDFQVTCALSITHGAVFSGFASAFLEEHAKQKHNEKEHFSSNSIPLSPDLLKGALKGQYLDHLKGLGFEGLYSFLTTFVGSLAEREKRRAEKNSSNVDHVGNSCLV